MPSLLAKVALDGSGFLAFLLRWSETDHHLLANFGLDFIGNSEILFEEPGSVRLALADLVALVGIPGARFVDEIKLDPPVNDFAHVIDALAVHDLELGLLEGR